MWKANDALCNRSFIFEVNDAHDAADMIAIRPSLDFQLIVIFCPATLDVHSHKTNEGTIMVSAIAFRIGIAIRVLCTLMFVVAIVSVSNI